MAIKIADRCIVRSSSHVGFASQVMALRRNLHGLIVQ
jgi:hypothetical protein